MYRIKRLFNPDIFQGRGHEKNYFEGWYFKCADESTKNVLAVIPGISKGASHRESHAFVQVIDGMRNRSGYFTYPMDDFVYSSDHMAVKIGNNLFTRDGLTLDLSDKNMSYSGTLSFVHPQPYPKTLWHPGIMGPFSFIPFMECYHDVIHMEHGLSGSLNIDREPWDFTGGKGYIEKDWGTSFPDSWVWIQCNHFSEPNTSFMLSYAHIPFLGKSFSGLIAFLNARGRFFRMTTYQGAHVTSLDYLDNTLSVLVESKQYALNLTISLHNGSQLMAPKKGTMAVPLVESLTSNLEMFLLDKQGRILFEGEGKTVGVEVAGELTKLD